jgi:hypothetical protein
MKGLLYTVVALFLLAADASAQSSADSIRVITDSTTSRKTPALTKDTINKIVGKDTVKIIPKHNPRTATLRSAILPGWGQAYNREYWKIPIVYGVIGVPVGFYFYNHSWYKKTKKAYEIRFANDTARFPEIDRKLEKLGANDLRFYRNTFRKDRDYAILYTLVAWGLNVIDATVFGHLKDFDVSDDLSLKIKPAINTSISGSSAGFSLVLGVKSSPKNHLSIAR